MKTANLTIRIDPDLKAKAQAKAEQSEDKLARVIARLLRGWLDGKKEK